jgi:flagellar biosynthesis protein FlhA
MDGASKFVRGDAIAGLLILVINLIGGLLIGMLQHDMAFGDAARTYSLLAIGDGLVAQLPALLISTAVAMLVTRATREQEMGAAVGKQVFGQERALTVTAVLLGVTGLVPGMPNLPFLLLSALLGYAAWRLHRRNAVAAPVPEDTSASAAASAAVAELSWDEVRPVEPLGLEVGYRLIALVDKAQGGGLLARLKGVRRKLTQDLGFLIPAVHVRDNLELPPNQYRVLLHGVPIATGELHPDRELGSRTRSRPGPRVRPARGPARQGPGLRAGRDLDPAGPARACRIARLHRCRRRHRRGHTPLPSRA